MQESENTHQPKSKKYPGQVFDASQKFNLLRYTHEFWLDKLTPPEYMVLMFIWQRTIFWGKSKEFIKYRHFTKGIPQTICGLPFKERRLKEILDSLQEKGVIWRKQKMYGSWYGLNYAWEGKVIKRKNTKKKRKVVVKKTTGKFLQNGCRKGQEGMQEISPYKYKNN